MKKVILPLGIVLVVGVLLAPVGEQGRSYVFKGLRENLTMGSYGYIYI
jgi:hypothetical protein